jgi:nucleoside-diphosphate-sugar epimerase
MKFLIAGAGSGLGKHLSQALGGAVWNREAGTSPESAPDVIIHSAWPSRPPQTTDGLLKYAEDTLELTRRLTQWPHKKFIFLSTAEVYPVRGHSGSEDEPIDLNSLRNFYGSCKLMAETIVLARSKNPLILRSTGLLGPFARPSSLIRILTEDSPKFTLAADSRFYYLLHRDAEAFIRLAAEQNLTGIYNLSSSESITLGEVAEKFHRRVQWGSYSYDIGRVDNRKIAAVLPAFQKTSREIVEVFASSLTSNSPSLQAR